jgi:hypothetical protein
VVAEWVVILVVVTFPVIWISAIVSASRYSEAAFKAGGRGKFSDIVLIVITGAVGGIYWWAVMRRQVKPHRGAEPTLPEGRYIDPSSYAPQR